MKIDNSVADSLLLAAKRGENIQEFMDAISGVDNYDLRDHKRQGHIRSVFAKELISDQFLLDFDDIIAVFWRGVFEQLDRAKLHGEIVEIKAPGAKKQLRPTNNNPIHFLRYHGRMAVRNCITLLYRKNLEQGCQVCGYRTSVKNDKVCPRCNGIMATVYKYVDGCETVPADDQYSRLDNHDMSIKINSLLSEFAETVLGRGTRAYQIIQILTEPTASREMCKACGLCGCTTFDINLCTNYNANIGKWLGVNKTFIANKVRRIRYGLARWLEDRDSDEAQTLLQIIPDRFKS